uniref:Ig-like domain-containing protein n=1 Tax=Kryptolebias marmoratus TaxID=37003 RepID=A0A3Q3AB10_KRYMA
MCLTISFCFTAYWTTFSKNVCLIVIIAAYTVYSEINSGSNVILLCSSQANPPVENYTWFKMHRDNISAVGNKPEHHIMEIRQSDDGEYFCSATNKHGSQNCSVVTLKVNTFLFKLFLIYAASKSLINCIPCRAKKMDSPDDDDDDECMIYSTVCR